MSSSLIGTLTPQGLLSAAEAEQKRLEEEQAARAASLSQGAGEAGAALQQATQAPLPQLNPMAALIQSLGGNVASIIGETPRYANNAQADLNAQKDELLAKRAQNLAALKDNYDRQAMAAQSAGDLLAEAKLRKSAESVSKAWQAIHDESAARQAMDRDKANNEASAKEGALDRASREKIAGLGGGGAGGALIVTPEIERSAQSIFKSIARGYMDPDLTKIGTNRSPLRGRVQELVAENGLDVVTLMNNFAGNRRAVLTLNGPQQKRMQQAAQTIDPLIGQMRDRTDKDGKRIRGLASRLGNSRFPMFNAGTQSWAQFIGSQRSGVIKEFIIGARKLATEQAVLMVNGNDPPVTLINDLYKNFTVIESPNAINGALDGVDNTVQFYRESIRDAGPVTPGSPYDPTGAQNNPLGGPQLNLGYNPPAGAGSTGVAPPVDSLVKKAFAGKSEAMAAARRGDRRKLKSILENNPELRSDPDIIAQARRLAGVK